ncbi:MAG: hypothetical protein RR232_03775 [Clostridia bacterium]
MNYETTASITVDNLRAKIEDEARFKRVFNGYEPKAVNDLITEMKKSIQSQSRDAKTEQDSLMAESEALKSELAAKNSVILALNTSITGYETAIQLRDTKLEQYQNKERAYTKELNKYNEMIITLRNELNRRQSAADDIAIYHKERGELEGRLAAFKNGTEQAEATIARLREENRTLNEKLDALEGDTKAFKLNIIEMVAHASAMQRQTAAMLEERVCQSRGLIEAWSSEVATQADDICSKLGF